MRLIFLYGLPATGKLTVAQQLAARTGYRLFHNHLVVDLLLSTFAFGTPPFVELREQIWLSVFEQACRAGLPGLLFTFNPESSVRPDFVARVQAVVTAAGNPGQNTVEFVELTCPLDELKQRLDSPSRLQFGKLTSRPLFEQLHAGGVFAANHMPLPLLTLDTSQYPPTEAAARIAEALSLPTVEPA